jgi:tRNA(Ile)-lysidine synthase TilS/MesJ
MKCDHCRRDAILFQPYSGQHLCDRHFTLDVERRAKRVIRKNRWIGPGDRIAVIADGDARSTALLHFLVSTFGARRDLSLFVVTINEVNGYGSSHLGEVLERHGLEQIRGSIEGDFPNGACEPGQREAGEEPRRTWYRHIQRIAREQHATRIALGSSVEDEAYSMISDVLRGKLSLSYTSPLGDTLSCIHPFMTIPEQEVVLYGCLQAGIPESKSPLLPRQQDEIRAALKDYTSHHPATPFALAHLRAALIWASEESVPRYCRGPGEDISLKAEVPREQKEERNAV